MFVRHRRRVGSLAYRVHEREKTGFVTYNLGSC